jgi:hypothetical protein
MNSNLRCNINKTSPIQINNKKNTTQIKKQMKNVGEYSLKQNIFDPTQNSPPNDFMIKLYMRDQMYNLNYKNDDIRDVK